MKHCDCCIFKNRHPLGLPRYSKRLNTEERIEILKLALFGLGCPEIGRAIGRDDNTIMDAIKATGSKASGRFTRDKQLIRQSLELLDKE